MRINCPDLDKIFREHSALITNPELLDIINRGYIYSVLEPQREILICGINPSYRVTDLNRDNYNCFKFDDFKTKEQDKRGYFRKFHEMLGDKKANYLDIFYQRHTDQKELFKFVKDEKGGLSFLISQLLVSQMKIEELKPKLILVFNRLAATFFGVHEKNGHSVWMGYDFKKVDGDDNLYEITGVKALAGKVNSDLVKTSLVGTYVYFSRYFDQRTKKAITEQIKSGVKQARLISKTL